MLLSKSKARILVINEKLKKSETVEVYTEGLTLAPDLESGISVCPRSTLCMKVCVGSATGRNKNPGMNRHRIRRTLYWWLFPDECIRQIRREFSLVKGQAGFKEMEHSAVRLNVASDILWELVPELMDEGMDLYDYTALPWEERQHRPDHYHLLYSLKEHEGSLDMALTWLRKGENVAIVIGAPLPPQALKELAAKDAEIHRARITGAPAAEQKRLYRQRQYLINEKHPIGLKHSKAAANALISRGKLWGIDVVGGDVHDARMKDTDGALGLKSSGVWVVLHAKGPAVYDPSEFIVRVNATTALPVQKDFAARRAAEVSWKVLKRQKKAHRVLLDPVIRMKPLPVPEGAPEPRGFRNAFSDQCFKLPSPRLVNPWGASVEWARRLT